MWKFPWSTIRGLSHLSGELAVRDAELRQKDLELARLQAAMQQAKNEIARPDLTPQRYSKGFDHRMRLPVTKWVAAGRDATSSLKNAKMHNKFGSPHGNSGPYTHQAFLAEVTYREI